MKKWIAGLVCMLLLCTASATAQERAPICLKDISDSSYWRAHPEIEREIMYYDWRIDFLTYLQGENPPDLMTLRTYNDDFAAIRDADVLADLSDSAQLCDAVSRMPKDIQSLVTTADGRIIGLPVSALVRPFYWMQDAWDAAGLSGEDVPESYTELLDFLDAWAARIEKSPEQNVCVSRLENRNGRSEKNHYMRWLMILLVPAWTSQQRYAGEPVDFNTPEFVRLLERTREIGQRLYQAEPREKERGAMLELFHNDVSGGEHANGGRTDGLSHSIPLRITADQPMLIKGEMDLVCVHKDSAWLAEALAFLEHYKDEQPFFFRYALYMDFAPGEYAYEDGGSAVISAGWLDEYRSYAGTVVYYPLSYADGYFDALEDFFNGQTSAGELARAMNDFVK